MLFGKLQSVLHLLMTIYYHNWYQYVTLSQYKILLTQNRDVTLSMNLTLY
jgi:hypothetical protein